jgi:hypothetical protein
MILRIVSEREYSRRRRNANACGETGEERNATKSGNQSLMQAAPTWRISDAQSESQPTGCRSQESRHTQSSDCDY